MSHHSTVRLRVLQVLVLALMLTLLGRLVQLQVATGGRFDAAAEGRTRLLSLPAPRGSILDDRGRPLARGRTELVISLDRAALLRQRDSGAAVLRRVAELMGVPFEQVRGAARLCSEPDARPRLCWNGPPHAPIPLAGAGTDAALAVLERREDFPGVTAEPVAVREYPLPLGAGTAHVVGYLGASGLDRANAGADPVGRAGLESQYEADLRGRPGARAVAVDPLGASLRTLETLDPVPGNHLVTHLDAAVQAIAERELAGAVAAASGTGADSGAVVVLDVRTGGVVAMASWPSYDPNVWGGGISDAEYAAITGAEHGSPNLSRAHQGEYPPASTFKAVTLPAAVQSGHYPLDGTYDCAGSYLIGGVPKHNFESRAYGPIDLRRAIEISCDTIFYRFAYEQWLRDGGIDPISAPADPMPAMARAFGLGAKTGLDLPGERAGRIPDRDWKRANWEATRGAACARRDAGYPEVAAVDPVRAAFLTQLAAEQCVDGSAFRGGDAANFAIGQGDVLVTPLQMATVYAAIANGGTLWEPHLGKAVIAPDGRLVHAIEPVSRGTVPVSGEVLAFLRDALSGVTKVGTAAATFAGFPVAVAGKTGTAEVYGKAATSWFASYAPAADPQYAVVMVIPQGGTGAASAAPAVRKIYAAMYGVRPDGSIDPSAAAVPGGEPADALPQVGADGRVAIPAGTTFGLVPPEVGEVS